MSKALMCDNCGATVANEDAESTAWLVISAVEISGRPKVRADACSRSCAHELLDGPVAEVVDDWLERVVNVERRIAEADDE